MDEDKGNNWIFNQEHQPKKLYQSVGTRYMVKPDKIPFNVDISSFEDDGITFSVNFHFGKIDLPGPCELYLDQFLTYNSLTSDKPDNMAFCLDFKNLTIRAHTASDSTNGTIINNKMIIPNEHKSVANNHSLVIHKGKKLNYICDIDNHSFPNAKGTITNLAGKPIFHSNLSGTSGASGTRKFTYALTGIDASNLTESGLAFPVKSGDTFVLTMAGHITDTINGSFLASHFNNSTTLHFSTDKELSLTRSDTGTLVFTKDAGGSISLDHTATSKNPNLLLTGGASRFIAEFVIIQK